MYRDNLCPANWAMPEWGAAAPTTEERLGGGGLHGPPVWVHLPTQFPKQIPEQSSANLERRRSVGGGGICPPRWGESVLSGTCA